jgi:nitroreductase
VQNLMLAALALGVGSVITTFLQNHEERVKALLGIPDDYQTACAVPLGYPSGEETFGGSRRNPLVQVVHYDRW